MDFGIDRLIEMIEQRISRLVANLVLYVLTGAVLVFGIKAIAEFAIAASTHARDLVLYFRGAKAPQITPSDALGLLFYAALIVVLWMVCIAGLAVIRRRFQKRLKTATMEAREVLSETENEARRILNDTAAIVAECRAFTEQNHAHLKAEYKKGERLLEVIDQKVDVLKALGGELSKALPDAEPDNQLPLDIGPKT